MDKTAKVAQSPDGITVKLVIEPDQISSFLTKLSGVIGDAISLVVADQSQKVLRVEEARTRISERPEKSAEKSIVLNRLPDAPPLLVGTRVVSKLLNLSERTIWSLYMTKQMPAPVRLPGRSVRWGLAEIVAWVNSGCPPQDQWKFP